jgi:hypothetical protein
MMRSFFIAIVLFLCSLAVHAGQLSGIRSMYKAGVESVSTTDALIALLDQQPVSPVITGYKGCATMLKAKHTFSPAGKLRLFRQGKALLEQAIGQEDNIELRYLRFGVQSKAPAFLGYNGQIQQDKTFLIAQLQEGSIADKELYGLIKTFLLQSAYCSAAEKTLLNSLP